MADYSLEPIDHDPFEHEPVDHDPFAGGPVMRAYQPTMRDKIGAFLMGGDRASPERRNFVQGLVGSSGLGNTGSSVSDFTPAGMVFSAQDAKRDADAGNWSGAAMNAMAMVPGLKPEATAAKSGLEMLREIKQGKASITEMMQQAKDRLAARHELATALADAGRPVKMSNGSRNALISPDMSRESGWRVTHFDEANSPLGHLEYPTAYDAAQAVLQEGFAPATRR